MSSITLKGQPVALRGEFPGVGSQPADAELTGKDLNDVRLSSFGDKRKILNIFPSVDTGVCAQSVRQFNQRAASLDDAVVLCISADLPFAQGRFCAAEGLDNVVMLSTFRHGEFATDYGVAIADGAMRGLTARAVIILDADNRVLYSQLVPEIGEEPDYDTALAAL